MAAVKRRRLPEAPVGFMSNVASCKDICNIVGCLVVHVNHGGMFVAEAASCLQVDKENFPGNVGTRAKKCRGLLLQGDQSLKEPLFGLNAGKPQTKSRPVVRVDQSPR